MTADKPEQNTDGGAARRPKGPRDRYVLEHVLGEGANARTWLATDTMGEFGRDGKVAIKEMALSRLRDWKALELFEREANTLQSLDFPGVPRVFEHFLDEEQEGGATFYLVEEWIDGDPLSERLRRSGPMSELEVLKVAQAILPILGYLHSRPTPVVHRDIKPANLIARADGQLVLIDFGAVREVAKQNNADEGGSTVVGTFGYMAPEQLRGRPGTRSDIYGLGATLCHLLTNLTPDRLAEEGQPFHLRYDEHCTVSEGFALLLADMMEVHPDKREGDIQALQERVDELVSVQEVALADMRSLGSDLPPHLACVVPGPHLVAKEETLYAFSLAPAWRYALPVLALPLLMLGPVGAVALLAGFGTLLLNLRQGVRNYELMAEGVLVPGRVVAFDKRPIGYTLVYQYAYGGQTFEARVPISISTRDRMNIRMWIRVAVDPDEPEDSVPLLAHLPEIETED